MAKAKRYSGKELIKILSRHGFQVVRIKGSHHFLKHEDGRCTTVPIHGNEQIGTGLLVKILRDVDLKKDELK